MVRCAPLADERINVQDLETLKMREGDSGTVLREVSSCLTSRRQRACNELERLWNLYAWTRRLAPDSVHGETTTQRKHSNQKPRTVGTAGTESRGGAIQPIKQQESRCSLHGRQYHKTAMCVDIPSNAEPANGP